MLYVVQFQKLYIAMVCGLMLLGVGVTGAFAASAPAVDLLRNGTKAYSAHGGNKFTIMDYNRRGARVVNFKSDKLPKFEAVCSEGIWKGVVVENRGVLCYPGGHVNAASCPPSPCACGDAKPPKEIGITCHAFDYLARPADVSDLVAVRLAPCGGASRPNICVDSVRDFPGGNGMPDREITLNNSPAMRHQDDMANLLSGGDGYIEMTLGRDGLMPAARSAPSKSGVYWFSHSGTPDNDLMIPTNAADFTSLVNYPPPTLTAEPACPPSKLTVSCPDPPKSNCQCTYVCKPQNPDGTCPK